MALSPSYVPLSPKGEELKPHGTSKFPIACYSEGLTHYYVPWHYHEEWEMILITSGAAKLSITGKEYILQEAEGVFINSGILHTLQSSPNATGNYHTIVFHPRLLGSIDSIYWQKYLEPIVQSKSLTHILFTQQQLWQREILTKINRIWELIYTEENGYEFYVRNLLSEIILAILDNYSFQEARANYKDLRDAERIRVMLQYIMDHYAEEITLDTLSKEALISESEVLRCFHNTIKTTPKQYLRQYRLQKACRLLTDTDNTSLEVALECGFQNSSYFTKTFREQIGCTPLEYRKNSRDA